MKKLLATILALTMLMSCMTACSENGDDAVEESSQTSVSETGQAEGTRDINGLTLPICEETEEISVLLVYDSPIIEDMNDIAGVQAMEEATNVHVNWTTYTQTEMLDKFQQFLATGEYFDIMFPAGTNTYPGGYEQGIEDGVLVDMADYIEQYMPNYMTLLNSNEDAKKQATYDDGKIHAVRVITGDKDGVGPSDAMMGPTYRADLLEKMGEDVPETIDELHDLLVKCKENGMSAPMTLESDGGTTLSWAWGVNTDWSSNYWQYDKDTSTVMLAPFAEGWDDWLDTMRDWYAEGLIDKNFTAGSPVISGDYSNFENDQTLFYGFWFSWLMGDELYKQGYVSNENLDLQPLAGLVLNEGDEPIKCSSDSCIGQEMFVTTQALDKIDIVCKWLDYNYTEEGVDFRYYGIEGESYTVDENGNYTFTENILHDPDGLSISDALAPYASRVFFGFQSFTADTAVQEAAAGDGAVMQTKSGEIWSSAETTIAIPAGVKLSQEENEYVNTYMTDINTLMAERMVKYILGTDTTSHDEFRETLKAHNVEEVTKCYQDACDRYNAR